MHLNSGATTVNKRHNYKGFVISTSILTHTREHFSEETLLYLNNDLLCAFNLQIPNTPYMVC